VYGSARMHVNGHLAQRGVGEAEQRIHAAWDLVIASLSTRLAECPGGRGGEVCEATAGAGEPASRGAW
jgi:hypothetical protein